MRKYRRFAIACALSILGDASDAEDVAQDAMINAYDELAALRSPRHFGGWLRVAVRQRALNELRSPHRRRRAELEQASHVEARGTPHDDYVARRQRAVLWRALADLPERQRDVLVLSDLDNLSHAEIAAILGISVFMSRRYLVKARRSVRASLEHTNLDG